MKLAYRELGSTLRPAVDVALVLADAGVEYRTEALIDTGSPSTFFDRPTGEALYVPFDRPDAAIREMAVLGGTHWVQFEYIDMSLVADRSYHWTARVGFIRTRGFRAPFAGVLGTEGFFDRWAVTFNKYYDYILIQSPGEAPDED